MRRGLSAAVIAVTLGLVIRYLGVAGLGQLLLEVCDGVEDGWILGYEVCVRLGKGFGLEVLCFDVSVRHVSDGGRPTAARPNEVRYMARHLQR